ncbi:outer membrane protein assembly factor BamA [soil metagenome]
MSPIHPRLRAPLRYLAVLCGMTLAGVAQPAHSQQPTVPTAAAPSSGGVTVDTVMVRGNERISASVVRVTSALRTGPGVTALDVQTAIRRLMATGQYEDVQVYSDDSPAGGVRLIIDVAERPMITRVDIRGLERINARTVRDTVGIQDDQPLNPNQVLRTEQMIRNLLAREGVQVLSIDTSMVAVANQPNTFRLAFNVREGNRLAIADIRFEGNASFGDNALRGAMSTREEGFLWFRTGRFDRETFQGDLRERLPAFYGQRGYIDFAVVSDTLIVDPETGKAQLVVTVDEGAQYRLGEFSIDGATRFPNEQLEQMFTAQRRTVLGLPFGRGADREQGEVFDRVALDGATQRVNQMYRNQGYLYAQVLPRVERVPSVDGTQAPTVNVTWAISEQSPFYINTITVTGNSYTHESVIRDRLMVFPGDIYNEERLLQSYQSIAALGFFETPMPAPDIRPDPENGTVDLVFYVTEKQTGSVNFGTAFGGGGYGRAGGVSGFLGYNQPNLFGMAKQADLRAEFGFGRSSFTASYTDPALFGTRNSGAVSLFHTDDRYRGVSFTEGRYVRTGGSLRYGFPVFGLRFTRAFAGYSLSRIKYESADLEQCTVGDIFCQPSAIASNASLAITRDTKNHPLFPTAGTRQNIQVEQTGGPLGGDGNFQKLTTAAEWWVPVGQIGGSAPGSRPIRIALGLQAHGGAVVGDASAFPLNRFFMGGTQYGQSLRGYEESTITPFGWFDRNNRSVSSAMRLGDAYMVLTGEYAVRFTDALSVSVFADAGNVWSSPSAINPTRLFRSAGFGGTIVTPFGPLGLDYAYGFDRDQPGWKFHFKINPGTF